MQHTTSIPASAAGKRIYVKCGDCLNAVAFVAPVGAQHVAPCPCGGQPHYLGIVSLDGRRYADRGLTTACDFRCTDAAGPNCVCQCQGENHGSHKMVEYTFAQGAVRIVTVPEAAALARAGEYRELRDTVRHAIEARYPELRAKRDGEYLGGSGSPRWSAYLRGDELLRQWRLACGQTSHAGRLKSLRAIRERAGAPVLAIT